MAIARPILGLVAIVLLAGGIVLQFLVILSGLNSTPLNQIYFLQADTNGITNGNDQLRNPARWTYLDICGVGANGHNADCTSTRAALPFDPVRNFGTTTGVPDAFVNHSGYYFYISRFAWVFYLIALFFAVVAFLLSVFALFARLGAYLSGFTVFLAVGMQAIAAALMTAWVIKGRDNFRSAGMNASIGVKAMAFSWSSFAAFFLASVLFCLGGSVGKTKDTGKKSYFGRKGSKRSTRERGSFIDSNSDARVKDEYE
ncbi:hypothetical protein DOTSEDRAFT_75589 [Dothistroma septosporum NZE10]|uniref:Uncharacterized protein n=1 Tax=Dothistroma septosporum (strain NZE10 / CBS 128990) TaxID=675120 RepID=M2YJ18_DOTSN|nr:hypothetical protein DOTSEDRAFT_75589 [Dothistroma septosporum NZE10]